MKPIEELPAGKGYKMSWIDELAADFSKFIEAHQPLNDFTIFTMIDVLEDICSEEAERCRTSLRLTAGEREENQEDAHMWDWFAHHFSKITPDAYVDTNK